MQKSFFNIPNFVSVHVFPLFFIKTKISDGWLRTNKKNNTNNNKRVARIRPHIRSHIYLTAYLCAYVCLCMCVLARSSA